MIEYFNKLSPDEIIKFEKFAKSPYYNSNKNLIKLIDYLVSIYPDISEENYAKSELSKIVYDEIEINDVKIRKLYSDFSKIMDKFLIQQEFEIDKAGNIVKLLNSLRKRGMNRRFESDYKEVRMIQDKSFSKDGDFYNDEVNLLNEYYYYYQSNYKNSKAECIQKKSDNIDLRFIFSKLHVFHEMFENEGTRNRNKYFSRTFYDEVITAVEKDLEEIRKKHPNIYVIYLVIKMKESFNDDYLDSLLKYLEENRNKFLKDNLIYYYNYITAYHLNKINAGQIRYRKDLIVIYMEMMRNDLFLIDNIITDSEFNSVVDISLAEGKYKWLEKFIDTYRVHLEENFAEDIYNLAKAKLFFHLKKFDKIFEFLNKVENKDPTYYLNSKFLLGRVYYETGNIESLKYILVNLTQYKRNKNILSEEQEKSIKLYMKFMNELIKFSGISTGRKENTKSQKTIVRKQITNADGFVPGSNWFIQQIEKA